MAEFGNYDKTIQEFVKGGKNEIGDAITDKGVSTPDDVTFQALINNIKKIATGHEVSTYFMGDTNWSFNSDTYVITTDTNWSNKDLLAGVVGLHYRSSFGWGFYDSKKGQWISLNNQSYDKWGYNLSNGKFNTRDSQIRNLEYGILIHK